MIPTTADEYYKSGMVHEAWFIEDIPANGDPRYSESPWKLPTTVKRKIEKCRPSWGDGYVLEFQGGSSIGVDKDFVIYTRND